MDAHVEHEGLGVAGGAHVSELAPSITLLSMFGTGNSLIPREQRSCPILQGWDGVPGRVGRQHS